MKRTIAFALCCTFLVFSGCIRPVILAPTNQEKAYTATNEKDITITTVTRTDRPNIEVGYVFASEKSMKDSEKLAREEAAKMGGHAIIGATVRAQVQLSGFVLFIPIYETFYLVHGTVIRYE